MGIRLETCRGLILRPVSSLPFEWSISRLRNEDDLIHKDERAAFEGLSPLWLAWEVGGAIEVQCFDALVANSVVFRSVGDSAKVS